LGEQAVAGAMASAWSAAHGARAYNGGLGRNPQRGIGAELLSGKRSPPKAEKSENKWIFTKRAV